MLPRIWAGTFSLKPVDMCLLQKLMLILLEIGSGDLSNTIDSTRIRAEVRAGLGLPSFLMDVPEE